MDSPEVLLGSVIQAGLDEVRAAQAFYGSQGIHSVPAVIINDRHLISGSQPAAVFEQALRKISLEAKTS